MSLWDYSNQNTQLLDAIIEDNVKKYDNLINGFTTDEITFGRFPLLSIMYLYDSKKLIKKYESVLIKYFKYACILPEETRLFDMFRNNVGKVIRLFDYDSIISPIEMLLCLGKTNYFKKMYKIAYTNSKINKNLEQIYRTKYGLSLVADGNNIEMEKRPLTQREINKILVSSIATVLVVAIAITTPFIVNIFYPFMNKTSGNIVIEPDIPLSVVEINDLSKIDPTKNITYKLANDIVVTESNTLNLSGSTIECSIDGNNKKIQVNGNQILNLGVLKSGLSISNLDIEYINLTATIYSDTSLLLEENYGTVDNVHITLNNANINFDKHEEANENEETNANQQTEETQNSDLKFAGITLANNGTITNCTITADNLSLSGKSNINSSFAAIVSENKFIYTEDTNKAKIENSNFIGSVNISLVDFAGICFTNNSIINQCANRANINYTNSSTDWNPNIAGICQTNAYKIDNCDNVGNITITDTSINEDMSYIYISGLVNIATNYSHQEGNWIYNYPSSITNSVNNGKIEVVNNNKFVFAAGILNVSASQSNTSFISSSSTPQINSCINFGNMTITSDSNGAFIGGICSRSNSAVIISSYTAENTTMDIEIKNTISFDNPNILVGGIAGYSTNYLRDCDNNTLININLSNSNPISYIGGICGYNSSTTYNCNNKSNITVLSANADTLVGGIIGRSNSTIEGSTNYGNLSVTSTNTTLTGGISGQSTALTNVTNNGNITLSNTESNNYIGGISGYSQNSTASSLTNTGNITNINNTGTSYVGGIIGFTSSEIVNYGTNNGIINSTTISGEQNVGGIVGIAVGTSSNFFSSNLLIIGYSVSSNKINVQSTSGISNIGGIVGNNFTYTSSTNIFVAYDKSTSEITATGGTNYIGGVVGINQTSITENTSTSYANPKVSFCIGEAAIKTTNTTVSYVGGVVGYNTYTSAEISGNSREYYSSITRSYSLSSFDCDDNSKVGGIVGMVDSAIINPSSETNFLENNIYTDGLVSVNTIKNTDSSLNNGSNEAGEKLDIDTVKQYYSYNQILLAVKEISEMPSEYIDDTKQNTSPEETPGDNNNDNQNEDSGGTSF
ncbi:MAG: hypothetical protein K5765_03340 [Clostridia bacterium]|nr:hypothetical protein [Clostridia bacterium]